MTNRDAPQDDALIAAAESARDRAYVPYSGFAMGAAVRTVSGGIIAGAIVENVSLGLAMCAERVALFACSTAGEKPARLAVVSRRTDGRLTFPCGACLQVALELGGPEVEVIACDPEGEWESSTVADLLPRGPKKSRA
jgi:cytidine deaminase